MKTISFVIPVYNERRRLDKTFEALECLSRSTGQLPRGLELEEVIFVNDGSTDTTIKKIEAFATRHSGKRSASRIDSGQARMTLISYTKNKGKGYAIKQGMLASTSDYTLFFDADMSTPLSELSKFMPFINKGTDVIIGTRKNGHSTVIKHQPKFRELLGKGFTKLTQYALGLSDFTDFTCGFKAFSRRAKDEIFAQATIDRWGYDAELIFLTKKLGFSWAEKAVSWSDDERTKVHLAKAVPQTLGEIAAIQWRHAVKPLFSSIPNIVGYRVNYK